MAAVQHNIVFATGEDFSFNLIIKDNTGTAVDIGGDTFTAEIRRASGKPLEASFTCTVGGDGSTGEVTCVLPATETSKLDENVRYRWDLFRDTGTAKTQLIKGEARLNWNISNV